MIRPEYVENSLDHDVGLISVSHVCYKNGHRLDLEVLGDLVSNSNSLYLVDDYQGCGTRAIDVNALGIDIYVAGAVKFLLGSAGVGFMFVKEALLEDLHPTLEIEAHEEATDASKFQIGTPSVPAIYESLAGLNLIKNVGINNVEKWITYITSLVIDRLTEEGFALATPLEAESRAAQVAIKSVDGAKVVGELEKRGIITTTRDNNIRTAWHFYNTPEDVEALIAALQDLRHLMSRDH
jgi:selenocysteine lyase/cysteine desulfurase